jgi:hypothetical protein
MKKIPKKYLIIYYVFIQNIYRFNKFKKYVVNSIIRKNN